MTVPRLCRGEERGDGSGARDRSPTPAVCRVALLAFGRSVRGWASGRRNARGRIDHIRRGVYECDSDACTISTVRTIQIGTRAIRFPSPTTTCNITGDGRNNVVSLLLQEYRGNLYRAFRRWKNFKVLQA